MKRILIITILLVTGATGAARAQAPIDWKAVEAETLRHFQALVRIDTSNPPGNETRAVEYLKQVLDKEGIPYQVFAGDANRANLVARIKGNGKKKPILVMGHTDVVTIDPEEVDRSRPVQRGHRRRLRLRPRHRGRQGQPGRQPDAGADAEALERGARPRRDFPRRVGRGRHAGGGRAVHDRSAFRRHRRGVLPRRGRRRRARPAARTRTPTSARRRRSRAP